MNRLLISATIFSLSLWATGCKNDHKDTEPSGHHKMADQNMQMASANIEPTKGNSAKGTVKFMQMGDKVQARIALGSGADRMPPAQQLERISQVVRQMVEQAGDCSPLNVFFETQPEATDVAFLVNYFLRYEASNSEELAFALKNSQCPFFVPELPDPRRIFDEAFRNVIRLCSFPFAPLSVPASLSVLLLVGPLVPFQIVCTRRIIAHRTLSAQVEVVFSEMGDVSRERKELPDNFSVLTSFLRFFFLPIGVLLNPRFELGQTSITDLHL